MKKPKTEMDAIIDAAWCGARDALGEEEFNSLEGRSYAAYALLVAARGMLMSGPQDAPTFDQELWDIARGVARSTVPRHVRNKRAPVATLAEWARLLHGESS